MSSLPKEIRDALVAHEAAIKDSAFAVDGHVRFAVRDTFDSYSTLARVVSDAVGAALPDGAMVLVPMTFDRESRIDHSGTCDSELGLRIVQLGHDFGGENGICLASCPVARAWLDELRKRGSK